MSARPARSERHVVGTEHRARAAVGHRGPSEVAADRDDGAGRRPGVVPDVRSDARVLERPLVPVDVVDADAAHQVDVGAEPSEPGRRVAGRARRTVADLRGRGRGRRSPVPGCARSRRRGRHRPPGSASPPHDGVHPPTVRRRCLRDVTGAQGARGGWSSQQSLRVSEQYSAFLGVDLDAPSDPHASGSTRRYETFQRYHARGRTPAARRGRCPPRPQHTRTAGDAHAPQARPDPEASDRREGRPAPARHPDRGRLGPQSRSRPGHQRVPDRLPLRLTRRPHRRRRRPPGTPAADQPLDPATDCHRAGRLARGAVRRARRPRPCPRRTPDVRARRRRVARWSDARTPVPPALVDAVSAWCSAHGHTADDAASDGAGRGVRGARARSGATSSTTGAATSTHGCGPSHAGWRATRASRRAEPPTWTTPTNDGRPGASWHRASRRSGGHAQSVTNCCDFAFAKRAATFSQSTMFHTALT